jgi:hypothetical protein
MIMSPNSKLVKVKNQPHCIIEAFADHFSSMFNSPPSFVIPNNGLFILRFLNFPSISDSNVKQAVQPLSPSKCFDPDEIPSFIIKGCSKIVANLFNHIFNISFLLGKFPPLWKQAAVVPALF